MSQLSNTYRVCCLISVMISVCCLLSLYLQFYAVISDDHTMLTGLYSQHDLNITNTSNISINKSIKFKNITTITPLNINNISDHSNKFKHTNHANYTFICDYNPNTTFIRSGSHHKTGTVLMHQKILPTILGYYLKKCTNDTSDIIHINKIKREGKICDDYFRYKRFLPAIQKCITSKTQCSLLHTIRNPVDSIISGYNYHKGGPVGEFWLRQKINHLTFKAHICHPMVSQLGRMDASYLEDTLQHIYRNKSVSIGIEIEFYRYLICEWNAIKDSYNGIKNILIPQYNGSKYIHLRNLRLEDFSNDFSATIESIFDVIGLFNFEHRQNLLDLLKGFDMNRDDYKEQTVRGRTQSHVTKGTFNKTEQIDALLNNQTRCNLMKQYTKQLDYDWMYHTYC